MTIGLVRHFKVNCTANSFMTAGEFEDWVKKYDNSDVIVNKFVTKDIKWDKCFSSDLSRAIKTARAIFTEDIMITQLLREVPISPICKTNLKLPYIFWCIFGRAAWHFHHQSQVEVKRATQKRAIEFLDGILNGNNNNVLIVCHGFFMRTLQKELKRRGFSGAHIIKPKNSTLYLFEKSE